MKTPVRYNGPYLAPSGNTEGRRFMVVYYDDGSRGTTLYSRYLMEQHLGRTLDRDLETVDHKNGDKTDDRLDNLQLLTRSANASKDAKLPELVEKTCPWCGELFMAKACYVRHNQGSQNKAGPFCSKSHSGKWSRRQQIEAGLINTRNPGKNK